MIQNTKKVLDTYNQGDCLTDYVNLLYSLYIRNIRQRVSQTNSFGIEDTNAIFHYAVKKELLIIIVLSIPANDNTVLSVK